MNATHATHRGLVPRLAVAAFVVLTLGVAPLAEAVPVTISMPIQDAAPGATVDVPVTASVAPTGLGIFSVDFRIPLDPSVVQSVTVLNDGMLQPWGTPFTNANPSFVALATAGAPPLASASTRVVTLRFTILPSAPLGSNMPLEFEHFWFNDGTPATVTTGGVLRVRNGVSGVDAAGTIAFALAPAAPSPARSAARLAFTLPAAGRARLAVYALDGRLVRVLADGVLAAGAHAPTWDLRDGGGARVPVGVYFVRLESGARSAQRRLVVVH
ncbi:MAG: hypothetical protein HZA61_16190 [Candidatus Eisenbacteria bacterium]|uniref:Cohesin domain-containing protein n=1 Tax=Eiseniibacteriota bacterium TaxID=2212470 RepID=A0A933WAH5_UNCEI|nr:hypothetical protein [Candidatus Eisenbacteria bacterium]